MHGLMRFYSSTFVEDGVFVCMSLSLALKYIKAIRIPLQKAIQSTSRTVLKLLARGDADSLSSHQEKEKFIS